MITILLGLTPFIFITLLGFLFGRFKIFDLSHAKVLNLFLYYIAVPALIIKFVAQSEIGLIDLKVWGQLIQVIIGGLLGLIIIIIPMFNILQLAQKSIIIHNIVKK